MIWIGGKERFYNTLRPRVTLEKLDKRDIKHAKEGNAETQDERDIRNLR